MKPFNKLSRSGRLRRFRKLAKHALDRYGLNGAKLTFLRYFANITYRVDLLDMEIHQETHNTYVPNRFLLRILSSRNWQYAKGEMTWLAALSGEAGLPVPKPLPTPDGELLIRISTPGIPDRRIVSLMHWVEGQKRARALNSQHYKSWGSMVGKLHTFASKWTPPEGFKRFIWDWDGLLGGRGFTNTIGELENSMPNAIRNRFQVASEKTRGVMDALRKKPNAFGMIHGDMYKENILFKAGEIIPIDFEDCGFGYWLWDIALALSDDPWTDAWYRRKDAFLKGYLDIHKLPTSQIKALDDFILADAATSVLWASQFILDEPNRREEHNAWREEAGNRMLRYFNTH